MVDGNTKLSRNWVLWYHAKDNNDWSMRSYQKIAVIRNVKDFWTVMNSIGTIVHDMYFMMVEGVDPIYESHRHTRGGAWLFKVHKSVTDNIWFRLCELLVCEQIADQSSHITGISVSPKHSYVTIRIWNDDITIREKGLTFSDYPIKNIDLDIGYIYQAHDPKQNDLKRYMYRHPKAMQ